MIEVKNLKKIYRPKKGVPVTALDGINLKITEKGMVFILGKSGSGKSTLLNILGGLDSADEGEIIIKGKSSKDFSQEDFDCYRNTFLGFIFQEYNILEEFTVGENISLALELQGKAATEEILNGILEEVDLADCKNRRPNELSGGQKQRVAIARALIKKPEIIMADEPTGALDSHTGKQVLDTLKKLSKNKLVIVVSHDSDFAEAYADRIITVSDGKVVSDEIKTKIPPQTHGENVSVTSGNFIRIKKGYSLTEEDIRSINEYLLNCDSDTIISADSSTNEKIKKAAGIDEEGNKEVFTKITVQPQFNKQYKEGDFKLIKSRLPLKNSLKMGLSSLKVKPFRLFMTVMLSAIAFCLFGLSDTIGSYDQISTTATSIKESGITYASFTKQVKVLQEDGNYWWSSSSTLLDEDIERINEKFGENFCIPVYEELMPLSNFKDGALLDGSGYNYYVKSMKGIAEVENSNILSLGYTVYGNLPSSTDEIAVTEYIYEHYERAGYQDPEDPSVFAEIKSESDLIGKKIAIDINDTTKYFTISAIINTGLDEKTYECLKPGVEATDKDNEYLIFNEFSNAISYGPHAICFTAKGFLDANGFEKSRDYSLTQGYTVSAYYEVSESDGYTYSPYFLNYVYSLDSIGKNNKIYMLDGKTIAAMGHTDVLLDLSTAIDLYNGKASENGKEKINLSGIVYSLAREFAYGAYIENPYQFNSFVHDQMTEVTSITADSVADGYAEYYKRKFAGYNYPKSYLKNLKYFTELAVDEAVNTLSSVTLQQPVITVEGTQGGNKLDVKKSLTVKGVVVKHNNYTIKDFYESGALYFTKNGIENLGVDLALKGTYSFALASMPTNAKDIFDIVNYSFDESGNTRYWLNNTVTATLSEIDIILDILSAIFVYVGLICAVFAGVLMLNFITNSIYYKRREIGVLRAVGARSLDVFVIFSIESIVIALINWLAASVGMYVFTGVINGMLKGQFFLHISLLTSGIRQLSLIFIISVGIAVIASLFPVLSTARKRPIDAIYDK